MVFRLRKPHPKRPKHPIVQFVFLVKLLAVQWLREKEGFKFSEIGGEFGVSRERIFQLYKRSLKEFRKKKDR